jgi:hypothetical protein
MGKLYLYHSDSVVFQFDMNVAPLWTSDVGVKSLAGRDGSVGMATRYGLHGPGISGGDFPHPSRPALGPCIMGTRSLSRG